MYVVKYKDLMNKLQANMAVEARKQVELQPVARRSGTCRCTCCTKAYTDLSLKIQAGEDPGGIVERTLEEMFASGLVKPLGWGTASSPAAEVELKGE